MVTARRENVLDVRMKCGGINLDYFGRLEEVREVHEAHFSNNHLDHLQWEECEAHF
jgi:hypothetical protein